MKVPIVRRKRMQLRCAATGSRADVDASRRQRARAARVGEPESEAGRGGDDADPRLTRARSGRRSGGAVSADPVPFEVLMSAKRTSTPR
jgi:hypothetical protein